MDEVVVMDMDVVVELTDPHNAMIVCTILTARNRILMYVTFFIRVWYNSATQHSLRNRLKAHLWPLVLIIIGLTFEIQGSQYLLQLEIDSRAGCSIIFKAMSTIHIDCLSL